jgi:putative endonuclease
VSRATGDRFEDLAAQFLQDSGFTILDRNYTIRAGEIDLVCDDHGTLVFVEVRARADSELGAPEETISDEKQRRIITAARHYLLAKGIDEESTECRFDVVAIAGEKIAYFKDAFRLKGNF